MVAVKRDQFDGAGGDAGAGSRSSMLSPNEDLGGPLPLRKMLGVFRLHLCSLIHDFKINSSNPGPTMRHCCPSLSTDDMRIVGI